MKKLLLLLAALGIIATACQPNGGENDPTLPKVNKIATIEEQSANITATITTLEATKSALNVTLASLKENQTATRGSNNGLKEMIAALEERIAALEEMIANLQNYTDEELSQSSDWLNTTFATLEQQEALAAELAELKALLATISGISTEAINNAVVASEESMKKWINEQLAGYATIAEVEAQIAALKESITDEMKEEISAIVTTLTTLKSQIEEGYKSAITSAINEFAGVVNKQIANEIAAVNKRIDEELATINKRLDDIEKRLDEIEETLENLVKQIQSLEYIDSNGDEATPVVTSAEEAVVTLDFRISPKKAVADLLKHWDSVAKVEAYYIDDINTIVNLPIVSFEGSESTGLVTVKASGENLSAEFYTDLRSASLYLAISDGNNDRESQSIAIKPQRWMREGVDLVPNNDEIYYTTTDVNTKTPYKAENIDAAIVSNLYDRKKGVFVLTFDGKVAKIGDNAFSESASNVSQILKTIMLPNSVISLGKSAFYLSGYLEKIRLSESLESIGQGAFANCYQLVDITIPESVKEIGKNAFLYCQNLTNFYGKFASKDNYCLIVDGVLRQTASRLPKNYTIPEEVKLFGDGCIYTTQSGIVINIPDTVEGVDNNVQSVTESSWRIKELKGKFVKDGKSMVINGILYGVAGYQMKSYKVPDGVTKLPSNLFQGFGFTEVWLPKSVNKIASQAFLNCKSLKSAYCQAIEPPQTSMTNGAVNIFKGAEALANIFVPRESVTKYQQSDYWSEFASILVSYDFEPEDDNGGSGDSGSGSVAEAKGWLLYTNGSTTTATKLNDSGAFNAKIISNLYDKEKGCWTISFDAPVTTIGKSAFQNCTTLTSITIPDSVTSIGQDAFNGCSSLSKVCYNGDLSSWCKIDFSNSAANPLAANSQSALYIDGKVVEELIIPSDITEVKFASFRGCGSIKSVVFHDNVTTITRHSFNGCSSLTTVTIGSGVTSIGIQTFYNCANLTSVYCKPTTPPTGERNMFTKSASGCKIYVPTASLEEYKSATYWSDYASYFAPLAE